MSKLLILVFLVFISQMASGAEIDNILKKIEVESGCKLRITSGKRSKRHNERVGGAKKSFHLTNRARDFRSKYRKRGCGIRRLARIACKYATTIRYTWHIHVDIRPGKRRCWRGRYKR